MRDFKETSHGQEILAMIKDQALTATMLGRKLRLYYEKHKSSMEYETPESFKPENYSDEQRWNDMKNGTSFGMK